MNEADLQQVVEIVSGWTYKEWATFVHIVSKAFEEETNSVRNRVKLSSTEGLEKRLRMEMGYSVTI